MLSCARKTSTVRQDVCWLNHSANFLKLSKTVSHLLSSSAVRESHRPTAFAAAISTQFIVLRTTQVYPGLSVGGAFAVHCLPLPLHNNTPITLHNLQSTLAAGPSQLYSSLYCPIIAPVVSYLSSCIFFMSGVVLQVLPAKTAI
jgi:hypothetical protein